MWISQQNHSQNVRGLVWVVMVSDNRIFVSIHARTHARTQFLYLWRHGGKVHLMKQRILWNKSQILSHPPFEPHHTC